MREPVKHNGGSSTRLSFEASERDLKSFVQTISKEPAFNRLKELGRHMVVLVSSSNLSDTVAWNNVLSIYRSVQERDICFNVITANQID